MKLMHKFSDIPHKLLFKETEQSLCSSIDHSIIEFVNKSSYPFVSDNYRKKAQKEKGML